MSKYLKRILGPSNSTFNVVILSEGYTSSQENQFYADVFELWKRLLNYFPFTALKYSNSSISFNTYFQASNNSGFATSASTATNFNNFQTYYDTTLSKLVCDLDILDTFLEECKITINDEESDLIDYLFKQQIPLSYGATLVFVLLPTCSTIVAETENYNEDHYYSVMTSKDGFFEQILIRAMAKLVGLGDEYEQSGISPSDEDGKAIHDIFPNLYYIPDPLITVNVSDEEFKWKSFLHSSSTTINKIPNTVLNSLQSVPVSYDNIQLIEGGGRCQTKIYRSAPDCLLRRKIGDTTLKVKEKKVSLCAICAKILSNI